MPAVVAERHFILAAQMVLAVLVAAVPVLRDQQVVMELPIPVPVVVATVALQLQLVLVVREL
jgi:hypothetical protein